MFKINNITWYVKFVPSYDDSLRRSDGSIAIGMCDNNAKTIYINETLSGKLLKKVLCHEITHAAMFSYDIDLTLEQEEVVANLIASYGEEIVQITDTIFNKLRREIE